jgi:hypothetical protein
MNRSSLLSVAVLSVAALAGCKRGASAEQARIEKLESEVKALRVQLPDQAAVMTIQGYHFTNLWFALDQENWSLAAFYVNETRKNVAWAARIMPVRKNKDGADVPVAVMAQAFELGPLARIKEAIDARDKARAAQAYKDALAGCQGCHDAASKPFIKVRVPDQPQVHIVSFAP